MNRIVSFLAMLVVAGTATAAPRSLALPVGADLPSLAIGDAKVVRANPERSYPPSCLSYPLPTTPVGDVRTSNIQLGGIVPSTGGSYVENVSVQVWRAACSGGRSAVLLRINRSSNSTAAFPVVPEPFVSVGTQQKRVRIHSEPNTRTADDFQLPLAGSTTFVLEAVTGSPIDWNAAFTLTLDTLIVSNTRFVTINVPAYNAANHPEGTLPLEITGYVSGSYFDAAKPGEGIVVEVGERTDGSRYAAFSWYTYDAAGAPIWLVGNVNVANGVRSVTIPASYLRGGGFAGNFDPGALNVQPWGTVTLTFPSCAALKLDFASGTPIAGVPTGSGTRTWVRAVDLNGFVCQ